ncbi:uncharacterized protein CMU_022790 [Cryptosporidium muris RN66]|uniref:DNA/RNA-binding protein Kin17 WH-like domain-containing protein n=1 Tax=Cryptosporidium muris (strain RN66) TaxID=441375 RepID=B6ABS1_CRYMR|nr:uncharacterized protein CMU_022790 [Cryptosporidium muris RN66]EEA05274.1 hypothetical protein, conserved [Cryptosporidium muris RN66]|eukprot:XP_002139623.1 hypothetical protein [Cryptosporidium muris RN66]
MPRSEVGTLKWVSKQIKAKGLQKLRWYCQLCEKQCRDENGFKCHRMSEGHLRQMEVFSGNPRKIMNDYSRQFESAFMQLMKTRYSRTRILANTVYNEVIHDRQHIHMNATIWTTLSDFVKYLEGTKKCKAEYTERGWYIEYIDYERLEREKEENRKKKSKQLQDDKERAKLEMLIINSKNKKEDITLKPTGMLRSNKIDDQDKITFEINSSNNNIAVIQSNSILSDIFNQEYDSSEESSKTIIRSSRKRSNSFPRYLLD